MTWANANRTKLDKTPKKQRHAVRIIYDKKMNLHIQNR